MAESWREELVNKARKVEWLKQTFVKEWEEISAILADLSPATPDSAYIRIQLILVRYQEKPNLLDTHLSEFVKVLTSKVLDAMEGDGEKTGETWVFVMQCCSLLYIMSNVRGYKALLKFFPHEVQRVSTLEDILANFRSTDGKASAVAQKMRRGLKAASDQEFTTVTSSGKQGVQKFADVLVFESHPWHVEYVGALWLSVAILVPFHLSVLDGQEGGGAALGQRIRSWCQDGFVWACRDGSPTTVACSVLLARLLSRPDLAGEIPLFLSWAQVILAADAKEEVEIPGCEGKVRIMTAQKISVLQVLSAVFKRVPRNGLLAHQDLLQGLMPIIIKLTTGGVTQRKAGMKALGRLALVYLKPKSVQYWHYKQETKSLLANLRDEAPATKEVDEEEEEEEEEEELEEEAEEVAEEIIGCLITGISDTDTQVRYRAARQLAYIALRLPRDFAEQVVDMVMELFSPVQDDGAWHGACLTLAEMGRRGLLLPDKLGAAIDAVVKALEYDEKHGKTSKGAHVRDAACYVAWAFARAFDPRCMKENIPRIAQSLVVLSVLDREVNCRRAAAAAMQEHVGRQGGPMCSLLPNAIDVITIANFFSLSSRREAYITICPQIARLPQYQAPLVDHLVQKKFDHWDRSVRYLTAEALGKLAAVCPEYMVATALPALLGHVYSKDMDARHGSILAVGEIVAGVYRTGTELPADMLHAVLDIVPQLELQRLFRGRGAEQVRDSACNLMYCIARAGITLKGHKMPVNPLAPAGRKPKSLMMLMQSLIDENLRHANEEIQYSAARCLRAFSAQYHRVTPGSSTILKRWIANYAKGVTKELNVAVRRGYVMALGALQGPVLELQLDEIIDTIIAGSQVPEQKELLTDAETRRNAVEALLEVSLKLPAETLGRDRIHRIFRALLAALNDYSYDRRGDVGSWVRASAMLCLGQLALHLATEDKKHAGESDREELFTAKMCERLVCTLLKQAVEKIDRVRDIAINVLMYLLHSGYKEFPTTHGTHLAQLMRQQQKQTLRYLPLSSMEEADAAADIAVCEIPYVPHRDDLQAIFLPEREQYDTWTWANQYNDWASASLMFPLLVDLLALPVFRLSLMCGLVTSVGGLSKNVMDASTLALRSFMKRVAEGEVDGVEEADMAVALVEAGRKFRGSDAFMVPFFKTTAKLLADRSFKDLQPPESSFSTDLCRIIRSEARGCKDVVKLEECIPVLVGLLAYANPTRRLTAECILSLLAHRYPKVRKYAAEQLFVACLTYPDLVVEEHKGQVIAVLTESVWDQDQSVAQEQVAMLMPGFGLDQPVQ